MDFITMYHRVVNIFRMFQALVITINQSIFLSVLVQIPIFVAFNAVIFRIIQYFYETGFRFLIYGEIDLLNLLFFRSLFGVYASILLSIFFFFVFFVWKNVFADPDNGIIVSTEIGMSEACGNDLLGKCLENANRRLLPVETSTKRVAWANNIVKYVMKNSFSSSIRKLLWDELLKTTASFNESQDDVELAVKEVNFQTDPFPMVLQSISTKILDSESLKVILRFDFSDEKSVVDFMGKAFLNIGPVKRIAEFPVHFRLSSFFLNAAVCVEITKGLGDIRVGFCEMPKFDMLFENCLGGTLGEDEDEDEEKDAGEFGYDEQQQSQLLPPPQKKKKKKKKLFAMSNIYNVEVIADLVNVHLTNLVKDNFVDRKVELETLFVLHCLYDPDEFMRNAEEEEDVEQEKEEKGEIEGEKNEKEEMEGDFDDDEWRALMGMGMGEDRRIVGGERILPKHMEALLELD